MSPVLRHAPALAGAPAARRSRRRRLASRRLAVLGTQLALTAIVLGGWQLLADRGVIDVQTYGSPSGIVESLRSMISSGEMWANARATLVATLLGFAIGGAAGILFGLALGAWDFLGRVFDPLVAILNSMPRIAFAPLLIVWFGLTVWAKVWMAASLCVFILLLNVQAAARSVDRDHVTLSRISGLGWVAHFWKIVLPSAVPAIFAGLRLSVVYAFLGVIASEMIVARDGLGTLIVKYSSSTLDVDAMFAVLVVIAVMAAVLTGIVGAVQRRMLHWQGGSRGS